MLVNLYKTKTPIAVFSFPVIIGLLGLPLLFIETVNKTSFFNWQLNLENSVLAQPLLHYGCAVLIVYIAGIELNRLVNVFGFYSKNTYLPGLIFAVSLLGFGEFRFSMDLVAYTLVIIGMSYLFRINRQDPALSSVFMASFFFGSASVFEPLLLPVAILPWFTLVVFRSFVWREWMLTLVGAGLPWFYFITLFFAFTGEREMTPKLEEALDHVSLLSSAMMTLIGFLIILFFYSSWRFLIILNNQILVIKKRSRILFHLTWISLISLALGWWVKDDLIMVVNLPLAIIVSVQLLNNKSLIAGNLVVYGWLAISYWVLLFQS